MSSKNKMAENQSLSDKEKSIVKIAALTTTGDLKNLRTALSEGLDAKLTINEIKEILVQMYAYAGFPRSLNGINTFMSVLDERKKSGIKDVEGKTATPINDKGDKYERGRKNLEVLSGQTQAKPAKGYGEFSPEIDRFLKEHLFADIFDSDVLNYQQRELATISALAAMTGVEPQLESHLSVGMNNGLTENQLKLVFELIERTINKEQSEIARKSLAKIIAAKQNNQKSINTGKTTADKSENITDETIFPKGVKAPSENFTGTVYVQFLAQKTANNSFSIGSVTFEPGARSNWHRHPAGQTLLVIFGKGLYQEKGKPIKTISKGDVVICDPDIEHWHGATPKSQMTHIAITNFKGETAVNWLEPVTDEEYKSLVK